MIQVTFIKGEPGIAVGDPRLLPDVVAMDAIKAGRAVLSPTNEEVGRPDGPELVGLRRSYSTYTTRIMRPTPPPPKKKGRR
jgi:hypothetical protein